MMYDEKYKIQTYKLTKYINMCVYVCVFPIRFQIVQYLRIINVYIYIYYYIIINKYLQYLKQNMFLHFSCPGRESRFAPFPLDFRRFLSIPNIT